MKAPKHPRDAMNLIYCDQRFSVDLDELTTITKKRYMNVNLFTNTEVINIGII